MTKRKPERFNHPQNANRTHTTESHSFLNSLTFSTPLQNLQSVQKRRVECPKCHRKRHAYCYDCMIPLESENLVPKIDKLPLKCLVVQHPGESKSKSSAVHAKVIAPNSVTLVTFESQQMEELFENGEITEENAVLLYPDDKAWALTDLLERVVVGGNDSSQQDANTNDENSSSSNNNNLKVKKLEWVVFIDSTWQQSNRIFRDPRIHQLTHVKIQAQKTAFWRYQRKGNEYLATIEAIYWFYREYFNALHRASKETDSSSPTTAEIYTHQFDDLLFLYRYQYDMIRGVYKKQEREFPRIAGFADEVPNGDDAVTDEPPKKRQKGEESG